MFENLKRTLGITPVKEPEFKTQIVGGGNEGKTDYERLGLKGPDSDHIENVKKWRKIYRRGGPSSTCTDVFPLFCLAKGYTFVSEEPPESAPLKDRVQAWSDQPHVNFNSILWQGILDGVLCGTAFQEIVPDKGAFNVWGIVPRDASSFRMVYDKYGRVDRYQQVIREGVSEQRIEIPKEALLALTLFPIPGEMYGASLTERAYDDIQRDCDMIESITVGVHRHGTRKNQVKCGAYPDGTITTPDLNAIKVMYENVSAKNDWITGPDVTITAVDDTLSNLESYSNITLQRMAAAYGVPDEIVGLGRGSTEATATVRLKAFYNTIATIQDTVARTYSQEVIDRITGVPGAVWIEFSTISEEDFLKMATAIASLRTGADPDAVCDAAWAREKLGIPADDLVMEDNEPDPEPDKAQQNLFK
jgi:hypothetical protein